MSVTENNRAGEGSERRGAGAFSPRLHTHGIIHQRHHPQCSQHHRPPQTNKKQTLFFHHHHHRSKTKEARTPCAAPAPLPPPTTHTNLLMCLLKGVRRIFRLPATFLLLERVLNFPSSSSNDELSLFSLCLGSRPPNCAGGGTTSFNHTRTTTTTRISRAKTNQTPKT